MKAKLLTLFSLLALLLVSTAAMATGRPTGIRVGRAVFGGDNNLEIDITVNTLSPWNSNYSSTVWIGNVWDAAGGTVFYQYVPTSTATPLPFAIEWGDGYYMRNNIVFGPPGGPYRGTFSHTYTPGSYTVTVGTVAGSAASYVSGILTTGNIVTAYTTYHRFRQPGGTFSTGNPIVFTSQRAVAITNTASVTTGTGIPALNIYGLLAMAFVLVGAGVLVFRKPRRTVA